MFSNDCLNSDKSWQKAHFGTKQRYDVTLIREQMKPIYNLRCYANHSGHNVCIMELLLSVFFFHYCVDDDLQ